MTTLTVAEISAGLAIGHALKAIVEVNNANSKVTRLSAIVHKQPVKPFPANIDTRLKAFSALYGMFIVLSIVAFFILRWINPSLRDAIWVAVIAVVASEVVYVTGLDRYHVNIGRLTRFLEKK